MSSGGGPSLRAHEHDARAQHLRALASAARRLLLGGQSHVVMFTGACSHLRVVPRSFKYPGRDDFGMKNLNIGIDMGSRVAIVGPNGAGAFVSGPACMHACMRTLLWLLHSFACAGMRATCASLLRLHSPPSESCP